ncbi:MAG: hypothetical protein N4A50_11900 [Vallitalea sp.]|jgi:N-glycosylase/DNA lyase|nr:hypothetical protein [Vallitalea sp.]
MKYIIDSNNIIINDSSDFDIEHILECGQCFRFYKKDNRDYIIIAYSKILRVTQDDQQVTFHNTTEEEFQSIWMKYFDLGRDYSIIKTTLSKFDEHLQTAVSEKGGIRILQQDTWESLISFIISQNNHISNIRRVIERLSNKYGTYIGEIEDEKYYSFPTIEQLSIATEEELRALKVGFRAPYIINACEKVANGEVDLETVCCGNLLEAKKQLITIKGVGNKVADCVLLFGAMRYEVFPTDVWVKRIMEYYYFKEDTKIKVIDDFAKENYGELAGFAQQYLFYYARDLQIGK